MGSLLLFWTFAKFSVVLFGGGYMILPLLIKTFVEERPVFTLSEFGNLVSISQITPGAVSLNQATWIGFAENGVLGAVVASFGLVAPTILLSFCAVSIINKWEKTLLMQGMLKGVRYASVAMICYAIVLFAGMGVFSEPVNWHNLYLYVTSFDSAVLGGFKINPIELCICLLSFIIAFKFKVSMIRLIILSAVLSVILHAFLS